MTDVHFHPTHNLGVAHGAGSAQGLAAPTSTGVGMNPTMEQTEMAAFEKGRMQGEMEAIRRMENEQQLKQFPEAAPVANLQRPDVVEINRLTWLQRASWLLAESTGIAAVILTIVWHEEYRGGYTWDHETPGSVGMWNAHFLSAVLGLFLLGNAITFYRVLPLNTNPWINRGIYVFLQLAAHVAFAVSLAGNIMSNTDADFWSVDDWVFATALFVVFTHALYSMARTLLEPVRAVKYETWAETDNRVTNSLWETPEQRRDRNHAAGAGLNNTMRTVYAPAPASLAGAHIPRTNANVGAQVPAAPANAPRWAENPRTHAEDYFLLPRAKWATLGFFAMSASILMFLAAREHVLATEHINWAQDESILLENRISQVGTQRDVINVLGLMLLLSTLAFAYVAMPPRTTLVKNGILTDPNADRRLSVSHNAETKIGGSNIV